MNAEIMKNMIVFKNLPSNVVDQAFIILKPNLKVKELKEVNLKFKDTDGTEKKEDNYVVKEAEMLINEYITRIEKGDNIRKNSVIEKKYKKMKLIACISMVIGLTGIGVSMLV